MHGAPQGTFGLAGPPAGTEHTLCYLVRVPVDAAVLLAHSSLPF